MTNNINEYMFIFILLLTTGLLSCNRSMSVDANRMYNHPGETIPITVEEAIGKDFNITCYMNPKTFPGINSTCLHFVIGRTNKELPRENIVTVNSTTIIYMVHNASEQQTEYRCKCGPDAIMETKVFVGSKPRPVKDFSCRSYDFDHMICNFTKPANPILTTYNVSYYNEYASYIYQPRCNYDDRNLVVCNTSLSERYQEMYHFIIESRNALVKPNEQPLIQRFDINNFEIMIPDKPGEKMRVESLTVDSIKLSWQMATWEKYRIKGLEWEVLLQPENSTILTREAPVREHNELRLRLNNLPYAYWHYKLMIRVRVRHPNAIWSEQFVYKFRTAARRPQRPPRVQPGSFYIDSTETRITVYWEELLPQDYNGSNFTYVITAIQPDGKLSDLKPWHQEKNLAKFFWQKDLYYEFEIRSKNHVGESLEASRLIIYPTNQRNQKEYTPLDIHNVYHGNNRTYTLTWRNPKKLTGLLSFTVYWCYTKRALPNECKESMHFQNLPAAQLNFTTQPQNASEERVLNLAVSANYDKFNTGLHWTDCSMDIVNIDLVKMEPELVALENSIKVQWSVERVCPSILDGFNISYCEVANDVTAENATCLNNKVISKLARKYDKKYFIRDLKPFTTYKVTMLMFWRTKKGKPSDPQIVRTLEGAPSPPRQLRVESITNTSATIKWFEPTYPNGKIRKYIIMLNNDQIEVNASTRTYLLENLESFTAYKVYVLAETVERSETSNDVHFVTAIGTPSPPVIGPNDNKKNIMLWNKPVKPSGSIDFYEVRVTEMYNDKVIRRRISIIMGASTCSFSKFPNCIGAEYKTTVDVRAVNAAPLAEKNASMANSYQTPTDDDIYKNNDDLECMGEYSKSPEYFENIQKYMNNTLYELYRSQWQTTVIHSCSSSPMSKITTVALIVVAMSLGVMAALYMARKKYNKMANINCTLPAGLETYFTKEAGTGFPGDFGSGSHTIKDTRAVEDQWLTAARMHDFNFRNEHHHLLASLGNDSGYLGGGGGVHNSGDALNEHILGCSLETANISEVNIPGDVDPDEFEKEHLKESLNSASTSADSLVESTEGSECNNGDLERSPLTIFPNNNGYIKQSMLQPWQTFNTHEEEEEQVRNSTQLPTIPAATSGYITVQNLSNVLAKPNNQHEHAIAPSNTDGYVLQQDLQNLFNNKSSTTNPLATTGENISPFNNSGYTTIESLTKLNLPTSLAAQNENHTQHVAEVSNTNPPPIETHDDVEGADDITKTGVISGYVTQQDLNIFAQHQHNH
ncbi:cytokine receptor [Lucilia sericata]|uniref:cytokine receptor n=1 Tax=Lucilia sericata TaxID=13632 RepID=UPI0018A7FEF2|nr:cytokine receptor [Lucilia sericata]